MTKDIHPEYGEMEVHCICGNSFNVHGTVTDEQVKVEDCPDCHPAYTGEKRDNAGKADRVKRFREKQKKMEEMKNQS